jgi:hypothetical protein
MRQNNCVYAARRPGNFLPIALLEFVIALEQTAINEVALTICARKIA